MRIQPPTPPITAGLPWRRDDLPLSRARKRLLAGQRPPQASRPRSQMILTVAERRARWRAKYHRALTTPHGLAAIQRARAKVKAGLRAQRALSQPATFPGPWRSSK